MFKEFEPKYKSAKGFAKVPKLSVLVVGSMLPLTKVLPPMYKSCPTPTPPTTCNAPDYPYAVYGTVGGLDKNGKPIICGGSGDGPSVYHRDCFTLEGNSWENRLNMTEPRAYAALLQSPFDDDHQVLQFFNCYFISMTKLFL